jgi:DNA-binding transcriptional ArsR family regulator
MRALDAARIFRHGLRSRILEVVVERGEASPADVAAALGAPLGNVSYHAKVLYEAGWIELDRVERRRGGDRHVYRIRIPPVIDDATWALLPVALRRGLTNQSLNRILRTAAPALRDGGFDHDWAHVGIVPLRLDAQGVRELASLLAETLERCQAIQRRSEARAAPDVGPSLLAALHYRLASPPGPSARERP